jgi:hypothetical protein
MAQFDARAETEDRSLDGIQVRLPRFEIESGSDSLVAALRALGMEDAFLPGAADFSRMTGTPDLFISQAFQKTYLRVDEAGTEAAAATAVGIERNQYSASASIGRSSLPSGSGSAGRSSSSGSSEIRRRKPWSPWPSCHFPARGDVGRDATLVSA